MLFGIHLDVVFMNLKRKGQEGGGGERGKGGGGGGGGGAGKEEIEKEVR